MKTLTKIITAAAMTAALALAPRAEAAPWTQISGTYAPKAQTTEVRVERGSDNTYGFISLYGDQHSDIEGIFGKAIATKSLGKGFGLGGEATFGSGVDDLVRAMGVKNFTVGPLGGQLQFSPVSTQGKDLHGGLVVYGTKGPLGFSAWENVDDAENGGADISGEITGTYDLSKTVQAIGRVDTYPGAKPGYWLGLQLKL